MNLCIDIGNSFIKFALFETDKLVLDGRYNSFEKLEEKLHSIFSELALTGTIISTVRDYPLSLEKLILQHTTLLRFDEHTPIPIGNQYTSPATLGKDRLAVSIGATAIFPKENLLIIDAGTCITFDFINADSNYQGGGISPGLQMRFKALNTFTGKLPLITMSDTVPLIGKNTEESIQSGVINGAICELDGIIKKYKSANSSLKVLITGGDAHFFESKLKNEIFVFPLLVLEGLHQILLYNAAKAS